MPTIPSEDQYRAALRALNDYNRRLAEGRAVFERRADALAATVSRISADLGSQSAILETFVAEKRFLLNTKADDLFYQNKGRLYAYYLLLRELGRDFEETIKARGLTAVWDQAMGSLRYAAQLRPLVVIDAAGDDSIFANHLARQGFYMKRSILQLNKVVKVLAV